MKRVCIPFRHQNRVVPYIRAVEAAGCEAVAVSVASSPTLDDVHGLVLMGGTDVNPKLYGQVAEHHVDAPDDERDAVEWQLLSDALERDLPILAICRGMQLLNVHHGGTLIQHLGSARHDAEFEDKATVAHDVLLEPASHLAQIMGTTRLAVNSRHHQAVDRIGEGLRVCARDAEDTAVIEGLEQPNRRFLVAVQWHPEDQAPGSPEQQRLFSRFAGAL